MTDEEEYAIRSKLKWDCAGTDWILLFGRRRMGRVVPDSEYPGMFRSVKSQGMSDIANLSWAKDAVVGEAIREIAWDVATTPRKCPEKRGVLEAPASPVSEAKFSLLPDPSHLEAHHGGDA